MSFKSEIYKQFASALTYPDEEVRKTVNQMQNLLDNDYPGASEMMAEFFEFAKSISIWKWEEIFTRTFDVQAISTLDIGYTLFGDDYKRGELLANLNREHNKAGNDCSTELADHLPNVLNLLSKHDDNEFKNDLVGLIIIPALNKIIDEFESTNIDKKNKVYQKHHRTIIQQEKKYGTVYQSILKALLIVLNTDFGRDVNNSADGSNFKTEFAKEMELPE
ncbi:MAG: hypothetical protein ROY99_14145 [Ignavibacterium sp.]|jgi:nitrate reductase assembly molybdenum cofactor insertion protein NarJ|nr:hypothetical protein [Ignavibacterium sp.]